MSNDTRIFDTAHDERINIEDTELDQPQEDESNWLVSYADMMTLLCGLFIMLFSMAKVDANRFDSFKQQITKELGLKYIPPHQELTESILKELKNLKVENSAVVKRSASGISIAFESTVFLLASAQRFLPKEELFFNH